jgi:hypothetical protein
MPTTTNYSLRYPNSTDEVALGATNMQQLASDVASSLVTHGGVTASISGTTSGTNELILYDKTAATACEGPCTFLLLAQFRLSGSNAGDVFNVRWLRQDTGSLVAARLITATTSNENHELFGVFTAPRASTPRVQLIINRNSGTGTATVENNANRSNVATIKLVGSSW